jgi:phytoene synthase
VRFYRHVRRVVVMEPSRDQAASVMERGSKSFAASARLFPADKRESVHQLYAWCRYCDDEIDGESLGFGTLRFDRIQSSERLVHLRAATRDALAGRAREQPFVGLKRIVAKHAIPARYPLDLIEGMAIDAEGPSFAKIDDVLRYSYHVAGSVGVMMAMILDVRDRPTLQRACDLGIAFQLTNISRDVISDAQRGRVYLPTSWLLEHGLCPDDVASPAARPKVFDVTARLLRLSGDYYRSSMVGIDRVPLRSAWAIASALRIYRGIGEKLLDRGPVAWMERITTGKAAKLGMIGMAAADVVAGRVRQRRGISAARDGLWTPSALEAGAPLASVD